MSKINPCSHNVHTIYLFKHSSNIKQNEIVQIKLSTKSQHVEMPGKARFLWKIVFLRFFAQCMTSGGKFNFF